MWPDTWLQWLLVSPLMALIAIIAVAMIKIFDGPI